jgi:hypothetical protein
MLSPSVRQGSKAAPEHLIIASGRLGRVDSLSLPEWRGEHTYNFTGTSHLLALMSRSQLGLTGPLRWLGSSDDQAGMRDPKNTPTVLFRTVCFADVNLAAIRAE